MATKKKRTVKSAPKQGENVTAEAAAEAVVTITEVTAEAKVDAPKVVLDAAEIKSLLEDEGTKADEEVIGANADVAPEVMADATVADVLKADAGGIVEVDPADVNMFVMPQDFTIKGAGHSVAFKADVPKYVVPILHEEAMRCGAVPVDKNTVKMKGPALDSKLKKMDIVTGEERIKLLLEAMNFMVERNQRMDFGANALPTIKALSRMTGLDVNEQERNAVWQIRNEAMQKLKDPNNIT